MHRHLRTLLLGATCTSFGYGLALATLPARHALRPTPPTPPPSPRTPPPRATEPVEPPSASATRVALLEPAPPRAAPTPVPPPKLVLPARPPESVPERTGAPRARSLLSGFRVLGPGQSGGVRLARVTPGSLPAALGLHSYDEIISVNGYRLSDPEQALLAYARLRTAARLELKLERGGAPTEIVYFVR